MNNKIFIIVQGVMDYYQDIKKSLVNVDNVVFSTWNEYEDIVKKEKFCIVNPKPMFNGKQNINLQVRSTLNGLKYARKLGATHAFKMRSDIVFSDLNKLISLTDKEMFYFPCFHNHEDGYFADYFQFGKIDEMIKLWSIPLKIDFIHKKYPEYYISQNAYKYLDLKNIRYMRNLCKKNGITCYWLKKKFEIISEFYSEKYEERVF